MNIEPLPPVSEMQRNPFNNRSGAVMARVRFATRDVPDGSRPEWGPIEVARLCVEYRTAQVGKHKVGDMLLVKVTDVNWAEYSQEDWHPEHREFLCENYRMQLVSLLS